jgi:hypothetical protein
MKDNMRKYIDLPYTDSFIMRVCADMARDAYDISNGEWSVVVVDKLDDYHTIRIFPTDIYPFKPWHTATEKELEDLILRAKTEHMMGNINIAKRYADMAEAALNKRKEKYG